MQQSRGATRIGRGLATASLFALLLGACSTGGGQSADDPTTTGARTATTAGDPSTTEGSTDSTDSPTETTDVSDTTGGDLPAIDYEELLPTAADLGTDWKVDTSTSSDDSSEMDAVMAEQCPAVKDLSDEDSPDDATADFINTKDETTISFKAGPSNKKLTDEDLQKQIDAVDACTISTDISGVPVTMKLSAELDDSIGDTAIRFDVDATLDIPEVGSRTLQLHTIAILVGEASISLQGGDALTDDGTVVPFDTSNLDDWANQFAAVAKDAQR
jgi:hypothetical protein